MTQARDRACATEEAPGPRGAWEGALLCNIGSCGTIFAKRLTAAYPAAHVRWTLRVQLWLVTILTVISFNAYSSLSAQSAILLSPAWLQLQASPEALVHSRTNQKPQPRLSSANSGPTSSHGENAQAAAPSSHAPSAARSLAKEGERAQRSGAERARGGGISSGASTRGRLPQHILKLRCVEDPIEPAVELKNRRRAYALGEGGVHCEAASV